MATWEENNAIVFWLGVGLFVFILIIGALLYFTQIYIKRKVNDANALTEVKLEHQKKLLVNSIEVQEKERARVAIDIHDGLIFELSMLSLLLNQPNKEDEARELLKNCTSLARQISHDLTPPLIESCHLNEILEGFIDQIESHSTKLFQTGATDSDLDTSFKLNIIRIIQEIINNTIKHASAKNIWLHIRTTKTYLALIYKDNGKGFSIKKSSAGIGQRNMAMRIDLLNGKYKLKTNLGEGVQYTILIPIT